MEINNPIVTDSEWLQATAVAIQNKDGGSKMEVPDFASRIAAIPAQDNTTLNSLIGRSITSIENDEVTSIGNSAFQSCGSLTNVSFPRVTSIGGNAFQSCGSLTSVSFPKVTSIEGSAFQSCGALKNVSLPELKTIRNNAFQSCGALTSVSFPKVTSIGSGVFQYCSNLTSVILGARASLTNSNSFSGAGNAITYVQPEDLSWYSTATNWSVLYTAGRVKSIEELPT